MLVFSSALFGIAVWLWLAPPINPKRLRPPPTQAHRVNWAKKWPLLAGIAVSAGFAVFGQLAIGVALGMLVGTAGKVITNSIQRSLAGRRATQVMAGIRTLSGLLKLGQTPQFALETVAADFPVYAEPLAVARLGGDVSAILNRLGGKSELSALKQLATAWRVAEITGATLAAALDSLALALQAREETKLTLAAELSAPRATSRLLAVLPLAGLMLGFGMGGDPLNFLLGNVFGELVLVCGVGLACAGVLWSERIANA